MLGLVIVTMVFMGLALASLWAGVEGGKDKTARAPTDGGPAESAHPFAAAAEHSLEGALFAELLRHEISRAQYRRAIERLAAREQERRPLRVPPEAGSDAGKI